MAKLTDVQKDSPIMKVAFDKFDKSKALLHRRSSAGTNYIETRVNGETIECRRVTKEEVAAL